MNGHFAVYNNNIQTIIIIHYIVQKGLPCFFLMFISQSFITIWTIAVTDYMKCILLFAHDTCTLL